MDDYANHHGEPNEPLSAESIANLRLALTGNNELKLRLISDESFLKWFAKQLHQSLDKFVASEWPQLDQINEMQEQVIVLRILVTFAGLSPLGDSYRGPDIKNLRFGVPVLSNIIKYVLEVALPRLVASETGNDLLIADAVESMVRDAFHVILVFANVLKQALEDVAFGTIWRLLTALMVLADGPNTSSSPHMERILVCGLELIPYCLERGPREDTLTYAEAMLAISLARLHEELLLLQDVSTLEAGEIRSLIPNSQAGATYSNGHEGLYPQKADLGSLTALTVAVVQILNYLKESGKRTVPQIEQNFFASPEVHRRILLLLKYDGRKLLNIAALNLVRYNLAFLDQDSEFSQESVSSIFEKLFPRIIQLLEFEHSSVLSHPVPKYIELPVSILSDLCLKNPEICVHLRNTNVDFKIMLELEKLFGQVSFFRQLHALKSATQVGTKLADFTTLRNNATDHEGDPDHLLQESQLEVISNYLLLLSVFTSSNEEFRRRITAYKNDQTTKAGPNFLCLMVFEIIDDFRFIVEQTILGYKVFAQLQQLLLTDVRVLSWYGSNMGVICTLLENSIFSNTFYLIRSLSRSVSTLRTFFVDCNSIKSTFDKESHLTEIQKADHINTNESIVDIVGAGYDRELSFDRKRSFVTSLLEILSLLEDVQVVVNYFLSLKEYFRSQRNRSRKALAVKKVILLASIANFILDFSSFRYGIINHETFLRDLAVLYMSAMKAKQIYDLSESKDVDDREATYEQLRIQLGVFQVVKNYLYNENEENRKFVWDYIPLSMIFDKALYGVITNAENDLELHKLLLLHKIIAFEIMRNLTAASSYFSEAIKESFLSYASEKRLEGQHYVPESWNDFLYENLMCFDLFVDLTGDKELNEKRFFSDDEFLLTLIKDENYVRLVVGINYLEDHRYTNISTFRKSDFPRANLLDVWKRFLEVKLLDKHENKICGLNLNERVKLSNLVSEVKVSVDWILINITWEDDAYGFLMPDNVNFRLLDTVSSNAQESHASGSGGNNLLTPNNIVIEESEEEDDGSQTGSPASLEVHVGDDNGVLKPQARAKILNKHGFSNVLQRLIYDMSTPKYEPTRNNRRSPLERFDNLNANDLYEKSKTAHYQIISLLSGTQQGHGKHRGSQHYNVKQKHPLRRSSNIINSRDGERIRREVNRESSNSHVLWEDMGTSQHDAQPHVSGAETEASDDNADEEIEEFWIR